MSAAPLSRDAAEAAAAQPLPVSAAGRWRGLVLPVAAVLLWWLLSHAGLVNSALLVPPEKVLATAVEQISGGKLWRALGASLAREFTGFAIGTLAGLLLGAALGVSRIFNRLARPSFNTFKQISLFAWIPLISVWFGLGDTAKVAFLSLAALVPVVVNTCDGISQTPPALLEVARVYGYALADLPPGGAAGRRAGHLHRHLPGADLFLARHHWRRIPAGGGRRHRQPADRGQRALPDGPGDLRHVRGGHDRLAHQRLGPPGRAPARAAARPDTMNAGATRMAQPHTLDLELKAVGKRYASAQAEGGALQVLSGIDLRIPAGQFVAVVGASGCGKSTLLRLILGLDDAHDGSITLGGAPVLGTSPDRGIVFQDHRLFPWLNVAQNIAVGLRNAPRSASEKRELVAEHIALVGLEGFEQSYPHQISGGMAQRVAIARGLVNRPRVLLLDEPFGALDALTRARLQTELQRIWQKERITMILVTHDVEEAVYLGDRVVIMQPRPGRIRRIVDVPLPHARNRSDPRFIRLRDDVLSDFLEPDGAPPTTARRWAAPPARWRRRRWPRCAWPGRPPQRSPSHPTRNSTP